MAGTNNWVTLEENGNYALSETGKVKSIETGKYKKLYTDTKGREMVHLVENKTGRTICYYICELLEKYFGIPCNEDFGEDILAKYKKIAEEAEAAAQEQIRKSEELKDQLAKSELANDVLRNQLDEAKKAVPRKRPKTIITCLDDGVEYGSIAKAAKAFGFNYDKFYNAFYVNKKDEVEFEGKRFKKETVSA